jgi:hypothetical protein
LRALESELHHDGTLCSPERLDALLHPDFHEVGRSGRRYTRATVIAFLASKPALPPAASGHHALHRLADGCALLTYRSMHRVTDGSPAEVVLRSSIWLDTADGWRLFYHQGTAAAIDG